jgi:NADH dehydrogenase
MDSVTTPRILVIGGGYVGMYTALRLKRRLRDAEATITVVDTQSYMTYQPFLPESAAGNLEPRHVVVPLRRVLEGCTLLTGRITSIDHASRTARFAPAEGESRDIRYDVIVVAPGSIARTMPIPGLAECGIGFKTVAEAIYLRNQVLARLDLAASTDDVKVRRRALSFLFIGGGTPE